MHKKQTPLGPDDLKCPLLKKKMSEVCHSCPWWCVINKTEGPSEWRCSLSWLPELLVLNAQEQRTTAATVDKVAAEMQKTDKEASVAIATLTTMLNRAMGQPQLPDDRQQILRLEN